MSHITTGIRKILEVPLVYKTLQFVLGGTASRQRYVSEFVRPSPESKILDVGCGPGSILAYLPNTVEYVGYDLNRHYIDYARRTFPNRGEFICANVTEGLKHRLSGHFDIVLVSALLHHLSDEDVSNLMDCVYRDLAPGGVLITIDCVRIPRQPLLARLLISRDRGTNVRTPEQYLALVQSHFANVEATITTDLLRVPYTHYIVRATKESAIAK